jgi:hypothetical protein
LGELVLELPGCGLSDAEPAAELEGRDGLLGLRHVVHGAEPSLERELGAGENSSRRERCLVVALTALIESATLDEMILATVARRADETIRPTPLLERRPAQLLRSIEALEFDFTEPLLELHFVASHGTTP